MKGVGLCFADGGAVLAVVRSDPTRLVALATVDPVGRRVLASARRRLGLARGSAVAVVLEIPESAELLASAGLGQGWVVPPELAGRLRSTVECAVEARLAAVVTGRAAELAVGAALSCIGVVGSTSAVDRIDEGEWPAGAGWVVQRIDDEEKLTDRRVR